MAADDGNPTSLTLLARLRANDPDGWTRLVTLYRPLVLYWCGRAGVRGADADDVLQELFRVAVVRLPDFRKDRPGDTFRGWLRGITRNLLLAHARDRAKAPAAAGGSSAHLRLQEVADGLPESDAADAPGEVAALMRRALDAVRGEFEPATWQAFVRTAVDGRTAPEAAAELGLSAAAVRQAKSRVLRRVKQELGELAD